MFRKLDPARPPLPLLRVDQTPIRNVALLLRIQRAGKASVMYRKNMFGV